jgi:hypothetical protein
MSWNTYSNRSGRKISNGAAPKQTWQIGDVVNVGFVQGLEVVRKVATPGDFRPDFYVLWQPAKDRFYSFQPHFGLTRHETLEEACRA